MHAASSTIEATAHFCEFPKQVSLCLVGSGRNKLPRAAAVTQPGGQSVNYDNAAADGRSGRVAPMAVYLMKRRAD